LPVLLGLSSEPQFASARSLGLSIRYRPEIRVTHLNPSSFSNFVREEVRHGMGDRISADAILESEAFVQRTLSIGSLMRL